MGLCHGVYAFINGLTKFFKVPRNELETTFIGVNHFPWLIDIRIKGKDVYPVLRKMVAEGSKEKVPGHPRLARIFNYLVHGYGSFFPWEGEEAIKNDKKLAYIRTQKMDAGRAKEWKRCEQMADGEVPVKDLIRKSIENAVPIISAVTHNKNMFL